jgi:hypothetical protein
MALTPISIFPLNGDLNDIVGGLSLTANGNYIFQASELEGQKVALEDDAYLELDININKTVTVSLFYRFDSSSHNIRFSNQNGDELVMYLEFDDCILWKLNGNYLEDYNYIPDAESSEKWIHLSICLDYENNRLSHIMNTVQDSYNSWDLGALPTFDKISFYDGGSNTPKELDYIAIYDGAFTSEDILDLALAYKSSKELLKEKREIEHLHIRKFVDVRYFDIWRYFFIEARAVRSGVKVHFIENRSMQPMQRYSFSELRKMVSDGKAKIIKRVVDAT